MSTALEYGCSLVFYHEHAVEFVCVKDDTICSSGMKQGWALTKDVLEPVVEPGTKSSRLVSHGIPTCTTDSSWPSVLDQLSREFTRLHFCLYGIFSTVILRCECRTESAPGPGTAGTRSRTLLSLGRSTCSQLVNLIFLSHQLVALP